jgi:hypothetical protein
MKNIIAVFTSTIRELYRKGYFNRLLRPYFWLMKFVGWFDRLFKISKQEKLMDYEGDIAEYLAIGTPFSVVDIRKVLNMIKRDEGYKTESVASELTFQVRFKLLKTVRYAIKHKTEVTVSYFTLKNNDLWQI